jgi:hypothetical protein
MPLSYFLLSPLSQDSMEGQPAATQLLISSKRHRTDEPNLTGAGISQALRNRHKVRVEI